MNVCSVNAVVQDVAYLSDMAVTFLSA